MVDEKMLEKLEMLEDDVRWNIMQLYYKYYYEVEPTRHILEDLEKHQLSDLEREEIRDWVIEAVSEFIIKKVAKRCLDP